MADPPPAKRPKINVCPQPGGIPNTAASYLLQPQMRTSQDRLNMAQPPFANTNAVEQDKRKLIQQQLVLLLHAHKCQRQESQANGEARPQCQLPHCQTMKKVLNHMTTCNAGKDCPVSLCASSRQIIAHWKKCSRTDCPVCLPLKNASNRPKNGQIPINTSIAQPPPPQPVNHVLNPSQAEMQKAYQALGLELPTSQDTNMMGQTPQSVSSQMMGQPNLGPTIMNQRLSQPQQPGQQVMQVSGQNQTNHQLFPGNQSGMQPINVRMPMPPNTNPTAGQNFIRPDMNRRASAVKEWHKSVTQDLRNYLVHKLVQAIFPTPDPQALRDQRMQNLVAYARKVENDMFETANSRDEYYHLLAEKICKIQKELEEKRARRQQQMSQQQQPPPNQMVNRMAAPNSNQGPRMAMQQSTNFLVDNSLPNQHPMLQPVNPNNVYVNGPSNNASQEPHQIQQLLMPSVNDNPNQQPQNRQSWPNDLAALLNEASDSKISTSANLLLQQSPVSAPAQNLIPGSSIGQFVSSGNLLNASSTLTLPASSLSKTSLPTEIKMEFSSPLNSTGHGHFQNNAAGLTNSSAMGKPLVDIKTELGSVPTADSDMMDQKFNIKTDFVNLKQEPMFSPDTSVKSEGKGSAECLPASIKEETMKTEDNDKPSGDTDSTSAATSEQTTSNNSGESPVKNRANKKVWSRDELRQALMPVLQRLYSQEPESLPFRQPVDPVALGIPDYKDIIKKPMDLSTIHKRLDTGSFADPWEFVDDVWLMFDNAWLYNKKNSRVYKFCTKLAEVFEGDIDGVMQKMGYCCGRKHVYSPQVLCCFGKQLCSIPRDAVYYSYDKRYFYCEKCFKEMQEEVEISEGPMQPAFKIKKDDFIKEKNDHLEYEPFVVCQDCRRKQHQICVLHMDTIWSTGFACDNCMKVRNEKRKENKYTARKLPTTRLGQYLEKRVNSFLKKKDSGSGRVNIRVLASTDQTCEVKPGMKMKCVDTGEMSETFPFRSKAIFAFEEVEGVDICFFGMYVQEYGSECPAPNNRRVYVAYLDSVHFFQPREFKTAVYHELLIGYIDYAKSLGYTMAHIWACPPSEGDDYIFHCHPPEQKIPKPKRLQEWYRKMLDKAIIERVVIDYKDILKDTVENGFQSCAELPYFEGDFWPGVLEDTIKQMEQEEEEEKRKKEEEAAAASVVEPDELNEDSNDGVDGILPAAKKKNQKNPQKKKQKSKSNAQRKAKSQGNLPCIGNDLFQKLMNTMDKHKEVFFVIRLHSVHEAQRLPPIQDPDPPIMSETMDTRDSFLALAREKHLEFSSFRRTKYSTMALLYELHNQGKEFVYSCNNCSTSEMDTRYHCAECEDYDLCVNCHGKVKHEHPMKKQTPDSSDDASGNEKRDPQAARKQSIQLCINSLLHACQCRDANCNQPRCQRIQRIIAHTRSCKKKTNGNCPTCKQLIIWCCYHAKYCQEAKCPVPFCLSLKNRLRQQHLQARKQQNQLLRRRMAMMSGYAGGGGSSSSTSVNSDSQSSLQQPSQSYTQPTPPAGGGKGMAPASALSAAQQVQLVAQRQAAFPQPQSMPQTNYMRQSQPTMIPPNASLPVGMPSQMMPSVSQQQMQPVMTHQAQVPAPQHQPMQPVMQQTMIDKWNQQQQQQQQSQTLASQQPQQAPVPTLGQQGAQQAISTNLQGLMQQMQGGPRTQPQTQQAITQLLQTLKSPATPQQQQQLLNILKQNPQLMVAFTKQRQQQQAKMMMNPGQQPQVQPGQPPPQPSNMPQQAQQVSNPQWPMRNPPGYGQAQKPSMTSAAVMAQFQQGHPQANFPDQNQVGLMRPPQQTFQTQGANMPPAYQSQMRGQQIVQGGLTPQQLMQATQSPLHQIQSSVRSPQSMSSPRPQVPGNPSPSSRVSNPSPISQTVSPHPSYGGVLGGSMPGQMPSHGGVPGGDQVMFNSLQGATQHNNTQEMCNMGQNQNGPTMTPQDQLSRFVDNL